MSKYFANVAHQEAYRARANFDLGGYMAPLDHDGHYGLHSVTAHMDSIPEGRYATEARVPLYDRARVMALQESAQTSTAWWIVGGVVLYMLFMRQ